MLAALLALTQGAARADDPPAASPAPGGAEGGSGAIAPSLFWQFTNVDQWHPAFSSPYRGAMSLDPTQRYAETTDATLYAGWNLWSGASVYINPEIDQGFGLSDTAGVAGFTSGEAYKIGANAPYLRVPRAFVRQVIGLAGEPSPLEPAVNQTPGTASANNLTLTLGKFSVVDVFDTNRYAHDPRADFLNWSVIDSGAFDYAADSWGFTYGAAIEWTQAWWTVRAGYFDLSTVPNGKQPDPDFRETESVIELEERHDLFGHPGKLRLLAFDNYGNMASYNDAVALGEQTGTTPAVAGVRHFQSRTGVALNLEQELAEGLGLFARLSANDGSKEAYEFTDINRSLAFGVSLQGTRWGRPDDTLGSALVVNAISNDARAYFAAGGVGVLIGDGRLAYASERISETYYAWHLREGVTLSLDYQWIQNPAYNHDRGPVSVLGLRLHFEG